MFKEYRRKNVAEMMPWDANCNMTGVSISAVDKANGSPQHGDYIARNPTNHKDMWLVSAKYFEENFEPYGWTS